MDPQGTNGSMREVEVKPISRLIEGEQVLVKISPKSMLHYTMSALGSKSEPVFTEIDCGGSRKKVCIKLDVSHLTSMSHQRIMFSVVEGQVSCNAELAETSAVMKAFTHLQENHFVKISDFSSGMITKYETCGIYTLVCEGMDSLNNVLSDWDKTFKSCEDFTMKVVHNETMDTAGGVISTIGRVYGMFGDDIAQILENLKLQTDEVRDKVSKLHADLNNYENTLANYGEMQDKNGRLHHVQLNSKDILEFVMTYFDLDEPQFSNGPDGNAKATGYVMMKFPEMQRHRFSGNITLSAKAYSTNQAYEEAAFKALAFIEKHLQVQIIDLNFSKRQETLEQLNKLIGYLENIIGIGLAIRMLWSELITALELKSTLFEFDPSSIFEGNIGEEEAQAYCWCSKGLQDVKLYCQTGLAVCGVHIEALQKLNWKLFVLKMKFEI